MGDMDNQYTYAMGGWSKPLNLSTLYNREKHTQTNGSQTPPQYDYMSPGAYHATPPPPQAGGNKKKNGNYPPLNKCGSITTQEDLEARRFVQEFKARRVAHKLTQSDIGERLNRCTGARYGQSYISRLESMQLSTAIVLRMKPLLNRLLNETENGMFADLDNPDMFQPTSRKKSKSNGGSSKQRKASNNSARNTPNTFPVSEHDDSSNERTKTSAALTQQQQAQYQRSTSAPIGSNSNWNYNMQPHHHTLGAGGAPPPTGYPGQEQAGSNFFISGLMSSLNPGVMTTRTDSPSSCKVSDPMEIALTHSSQLYNPYRVQEPKQEIQELSPIQPRPPHPSPAGLRPVEELRHHAHHAHHEHAHHFAPPSSFSPNFHELTPSIKTEPQKQPQITTLHPPLKPG